IPAFLADEEPGAYISVYPFVRSYEWYLLPDEERRAILADHGRAAREFPDVRANTVPAFTLGDYEWLLAFEAPALDRRVDLMRAMTATEARRHVRVEIPFFTVPRVSAEHLATTLPWPLVPARSRRPVGPFPGPTGRATGLSRRPARVSG